MEYVYTAVFRAQPEGGLLILFPDFAHLCGRGLSIKDSVAAAEDILGLCLYNMEIEGMTPPHPTPPHEITLAHTEFSAPVIINTTKLAAKYGNKTVRHKVEMPVWLEQKAAESGLDLSRVLASGLKSELGISAGGARTVVAGAPPTPQPFVQMPPPVQMPAPENAAPAPAQPMQQVLYPPNTYVPADATMAHPPAHAPADVHHHEPAPPAPPYPLMQGGYMQQTVHSAYYVNHSAPHSTPDPNLPEDRAKHKRAMLALSIAASVVILVGWLAAIILFFERVMDYGPPQDAYTEQGELMDERHSE